MADETSPGGSRIYRHDEPSAPHDSGISGGDPALIDAIDAHLDRCFGKNERWPSRTNASTGLSAS